MKVYLFEDEWWPVYVAWDNPRKLWVELTEAEYKKWQKAEKAFREWQKIIQERLEETPQ